MDSVQRVCSAQCRERWCSIDQDEEENEDDFWQMWFPSQFKLICNTHYFGQKSVI